MLIHAVRCASPTPLRRYLRKAFPLLSQDMLLNALRRRDIKREGKRLRAEDTIAPGDTLAIYIDERYLYALPPCAYQDERYIVFIKPRGIPSTGDGSLQQAVSALHPIWEACHRLDTRTGGLILFAKDAPAREAAVDAFLQQQVTKIYRACVVGFPDPAEAELTAYLLKDAKAARVRIADAPCPGALTIRTGYSLHARYDGYSDLRVRLYTGRTHQIRAHMARIGHPVLGDDLYGNREANRFFSARSLMLWASELSIPSLLPALISAPPWEEE